MAGCLSMPRPVMSLFGNLHQAEGKAQAIQAEGLCRIGQGGRLDTAARREDRLAVIAVDTGSDRHETIVQPGIGLLLAPASLSAVRPASSS